MWSYFRLQVISRAAAFRMDRTSDMHDVTTILLYIHIFDISTTVQPKFYKKREDSTAL